MELLPRITRAQSMDVLSSQANLAGYRAVVEGAGAFDRGFPMLMTAAGTIPAAKVLVMGAGVAGLQAIATARRLGRARLGHRRAAGRQGGDQVPRRQLRRRRGRGEPAAAQTAGGYAKQMSDASLRKQAEVVGAAVGEDRTWWSAPLWFRVAARPSW